MSTLPLLLEDQPGGFFEMVCSLSDESTPHAPQKIHIDTVYLNSPVWWFQIGCISCNSGYKLMLKHFPKLSSTRSLACQLTSALTIIVSTLRILKMSWGVKNTCFEVFRGVTN